MSVKLSPCPFCGSDDLVGEDVRGPHGGWWFECSTCMATGPMQNSESSKDVELWDEAAELWGCRSHTAIIAALPQFDAEQLDAIADALVAARAAVEAKATQEE